MSEVTVTLPPPSVPKPLPPASITKPHPPPIVTTNTKEMRERQKDRILRARQKFSPPSLPPPSPPPYSSISPPPSPLSPTLHLSAPPITHERTPPPPRPPPPTFPPPLAPPRHPTPLTPQPPSQPLSAQATSHSPEPPQSSSPNEEVVNEVTRSGDMNTNDGDGDDVEERPGEEGEGVSGDGEGVSGDGEEPHYERAPVSGIVSEAAGETEECGPDYVNVDSLEDEEDEEEGEGEGEGEGGGGKPFRYSIAQQNYQNWDFIGESDSDDDNSTPHPSHHHHPTQSNPPTLPFNTHPVLMKKKGGNSKLSKSKGKRRNRAPPPPPGAKNQGRQKPPSGPRVVNQEQEEKEREREREREREIEKREREEPEEVAIVGDGEEHDYSTIRRGDYINWEFEQGDGSESDNDSPPKPKPHKPSNPPTLPLNTHPVLMRSQSHDHMFDRDTDDADGKRPKNRAPPPPPAKTKSKPPRGLSHQFSQPQTQLGSDVCGGREASECARVTKPPLQGHKRTKSDQPELNNREEMQNSTEQQAAKDKQQTHWDKQQLASKDKRVPKDKQQEASKGKQQETKKPMTPPQQKRPLQVIASRSAMHPNQYSPLATHKNGEATPLSQRGRSPVPTRASEIDVVMGPRGGGGKGGEGGPSKPLPRVPAGKKRHSAAELEVEGKVKEREQANPRQRDSSGAWEHLMRPKRQAPPPPMGRPVSMEQPEEAVGREPPQGAEAPSLDKQAVDSKAEVRVQTPPPKPKRLHRRTPPCVENVTIATEASPTTQESTETEERQTSSAGTPRGAENGQDMNRWERLLHKMEFFTIDLIKEGDRSLGMVIVSGKVRNKDGSTVEGIFIQKILPGSLTDKDGRIQAGDMLVEINGTSMVGATVDLASKRLRDSRDSVKLKVGRPDRGAFKVPGDDDKEPIYMNNDDLQDSELQERMEKAEARVAKMDELRNKAEKELKVFREMADKEQKNFRKKLEETEERQEAYKKDVQTKITDLTVALANITVEKTKLEKELESLRSSQPSHSSDQDDQITSLKRQLKESESEREMAERDLQQLRQETETNADLQSRLAELESDLGHARQERDAVRRQLESTCHELSVAHATLEQMQMEKAALEKEKERVSLELERERKPSTGQASVEAELAQKRRELSSVQREVQGVREEKKREVGEVRGELEREKERSAELERRLQSQQRTEKTTMTDLVTRIQTQAKQIQDLKEELCEAKSQSPTSVAVAAVEVREEEQGEAGVGQEEREDEAGEPDQKPMGKPTSLDAVTVEDKNEEQKSTLSPVQAESLPTSSPKRSRQEKSSSPGKEKKKSSKTTKDEHHVSTEDSISIDAFDDIKATSVLDNTLAKDKSQAALRNTKRPRNRPSREHIRSMSTENLLSGPLFEEFNTEMSPTDKIPIPRPRKPTMEKDKDSASQKPLPVPRHPRSPAPPHNDPPQRPPKPYSQTAAELERASPDRKTKQSGRMSPPHTRAPSPKPLLPPVTKGGLPPKPVPRRMNKRSNEDLLTEEAQTKDPSQLSVKERMELARQKQPPPVVPKKPSGRPHVDSDLRSLSQPEGDEGEHSGVRHSVNNDPSPRHVRRLPPGAFNMMGMTPFGQRPRSHTVATSREPSLDRDMAEEYKEQMEKEGEKDRGSTEAIETDDIEIKFPPKRPPPPHTKRTSSNEKPALLASRSTDVLLETAPTPPPSAPSPETQEEETDSGDTLHTGEHGTLPDPTGLDYDQVLTWSPVDVASWMTRIGASQHAKVFLNRGVQGNKLFDMDGGVLKAMGVSSSEDRLLIKREIKALRPHAEKHKKVLEKQRKDDKKKKKRYFV